MPNIADHDTFMFKGQQSHIFAAGQTIPDGWNDAPEVPYPAEGEYDWVIEEFHTPKSAQAQRESGIVEPVKRGPGRPPKTVEQVLAESPPEVEA